MTSVFGLGNVLMGDDGLGPAVIRRLEAEYIVDSEVEVIDLGTPGLDLLPWLADADRVVLVDAVKSDRPPGTVIVYDKADILRHAPMQRVGPHDPGVKDALFALEFAGRAPRDVTLVGVVPSTSAMDLALSPAVEAALPVAVDAVVAALVASGCEVRRRAASITTPPWHAAPTSPAE